MFGEINPKFKGINNNFAFSLLGTANQVTVTGTYPSFTLSLPATVITTTFQGALTGHASLDLLASNNLSDVPTPATARSNLGLAIGTNVEAWSAQLDTLSAYNTNGLFTQTASGTYTGRTITGTSGTISVSNGSGVSGNPTITIDATYVGQTSITTLGTIGTGTWQGTAVAGQYGGTGVVNTGKTITLGGNISTANSFTTSGNFPVIQTYTGATNVTFPTSGTLATTTGTTSSIYTDLFCVSRCGGF